MTNKKRIYNLVNRKYNKPKIITLKQALQHVRKLEKELRNIPIGSKIFHQKVKELRKAKFKMRWIQLKMSEFFETDPMKNPITYWISKTQEIMAQLGY